MRIPYLLLVSAVAGLTLAPITAATAQQQQQGQQPPAAADNITQGELETFAMASLEVQRISQSYQPRMESAEDAAQKKAVQQEAIEEMTAAVRDSGMSVQKYNQIATAVRSNPGLASQVQDYMRQAQ